MATITRREIFNNTSDQIREYLKTAENICREQGYPPDDYPDVFVAVLGLVSGKQIIMEQTPTVGMDLSSLRGLPNGH